MSSTIATPPLPFVAQNNRGLDFLKNGDIIQARKCFTDALRGAQVGLIQERNNSEQEDDAATTTNPDPQQRQAASNDPFSVRDQLFSRLRALPTSTLEDQALSIFMDMSQASSANMALIYAVIIYNMGLVYHIRGQECKASNALQKATELYQKSLSIVMVELQGAPAAPRNPIVDLLRMLLLKHIADIYTHLSNYELARTFGDELASFINSVGCFQYRDARVTEFMRAQVGCFLMYSFSLEQGSRMAPAA